MNRRELFKGFGVVGASVIAAGVAVSVVSQIPPIKKIEPKREIPSLPPESSQLLYVECDGDNVAKKITLGELKEYLSA